MNIKIPRFLQRTLWLIAGAGLVFTLVSAVEMKRNTAISQTHVEFAHTKPMEHMLTSDDIYGILYEHFTSDLQGVPVRHVDTKWLEELVEANDYVKSAKVYVDKLDQLWIEISEREPLGRIMTGDKPYYIDINGVRLEWSEHYSPRVPVVSGFIANDEESMNEVVGILLKIRKDPFLADLLDQLIVDQNGQYIFIPTVGSQQILIGRADDLDKKLENLKGYYSQYINADGWQHCKSLDLRYKGQVICGKQLRT